VHVTQANGHLTPISAYHPILMMQQLLEPFLHDMQQTFFSNVRTQQHYTCRKTKMRE
jgi:hypothetical protein